MSLADHATVEIFKGRWRRLPVEIEGNEEWLRQSNVSRMLLDVFMTDEDESLYEIAFSKWKTLWQSNRGLPDHQKTNFSTTTPHNSLIKHSKNTEQEAILVDGGTSIGGYHHQPTFWSKWSSPSNENCLQTASLWMEWSPRCRYRGKLHRHPIHPI